MENSIISFGIFLNRKPEKSILQGNSCYIKGDTFPVHSKATATIPGITENEASHFPVFSEGIFNVLRDLGMNVPEFLECVLQFLYLSLLVVIAHILSYLMRKNPLFHACVA